MPNNKNVNGWQVAGETIGDVLGHAVEGLLKPIEGLLDFGTAAIGGLGGIWDKDFGDKIKKLVARDFTDELYGRHMRAGTRNSALYNADAKTQRLTRGVASGLGQVGGMFIGGGTGKLLGMGAKGVKALSLGGLGVGAAGSGTEEALQHGANYGQALGSGALQGGIEVGTEMLGGGAYKSLLGKGFIDKVGKNVAKTGLKRVGREMLEEGGEEVVSELLNPLTRRIYDENALEDYKSREYWQGVGEAGVVGGLTSGVFGGTVGRIAKTSGKYADVEAIQESINENFRTFDKSQRTAEDQRMLTRNLRTNLENMQDILTKSSDKKRAELIDRYRLSENFNSDGTIKTELSTELGIDTSNKPLANVDKRYISSSLIGKMDMVSNTLDKARDGASKQLGRDVGEVKVFDGELSEQGKENYSKIINLERNLSDKAGHNIGIVIFEGDKAVHGFIDDDIIYMNRKEVENGSWDNFIDSDQNPTTKVFHENAHFAENSNTAKYEYDDYIAENYGEQNIEAQAEVQENYKGYSADVMSPIIEKIKHGEELSETEQELYEGYSNETFAHQTEKVLFDKDFIRRMVLDNDKLTDRVLGYIMKMKRNFKKIGNKDVRKLDKAEKMYLNAIKEAGKYYQFKKYFVNTDDDEDEDIQESETKIKPSELNKAKDTYNDAQFSISAAENMAENRVEYAKNKKSAIDLEEILKGNDMIREMANIMAKYKDLLPQDKIGKVIQKNGSYDRSVENTTICLRTLVYNAFVEKVQEKLNRPLTQMESFLVSQKLYDIAKEPQCLYCYVSLDRKAYGEYLNRYFQVRDEVIEKWRNSDKSEEAKKEIFNFYLVGLPTAEVEKRKASKLPIKPRKVTKNIQANFNLFLKLADDPSLPMLTLSDIATESRRKQVDRKGGELASQWKKAHAYAQSASYAKKQLEYVAYYDEILKLNQRIVNQLNAHYGMRWYSFSDYSGAFIVENMQQILDASMRGLKGLAYTKDTDFAKIFAPTGMNINISMFVKEKNGKFEIDSRQSANLEEAIALRKKYPNVGIVITATSDAGVKWALAQEWSDVVIPFHIVKTGKDVAEFYKWDVYTQSQTDRVIDQEKWDAYLESIGKKKAGHDIYPHEHQNDFATYMRLINERGLKPRFSEFIDDPNYMKLVNETRRSESETTPLQPNFDMNAAKESFDTFVEKGGYYGGWYNEGVNEDAEVDEVVRDVQQGKKANEVSYGRQDVDFDAQLSMRKKVRSHGVSFSLKDSDGNSLSEEQQEFFKDSKTEDKTSTKEMEYSIGGDKAVMTNERIEDLIEYSSAGERSDYARYWFTAINPSDFIDLTTQVKNDREYFDTKALSDFGQTNADYDYIKALKDAKTPYLDVDIKTGQVLSHDGRHRMRELEKRGIKSAEIIIEFYEDGRLVKTPNGVGNELRTEWFRSLRNQWDGSHVTAVHHLIPLTNTKRTRRDIKLFYRYGEENKLTDNDIQFSLKDSDGNSLSEEQQEFFKDSKVRNDKGELEVVYHSSNQDFSVFDKSKAMSNTQTEDSKLGFFFSNNKDITKQFGNKTKSYYLDIKKPLDMRDIATNNALIKELAKVFNVEENNVADSVSDFNTLGEFYNELADSDVLSKIKSLGYDGIIRVMDYKNGYNEYIAFESNQIKLTTNKTPTSSDDIRYSLKDDARESVRDANTIKYKTYSRSDAEMILDVIMADENFNLGEYDIKIAGKTRQEAIDLLWAELNKHKSTKKVVDTITEYIFNNAILEDVYRDSKNAPLFETVEMLRGYYRGLDLSHIRDEIKHRYDKDNSVYARWSKAQRNGTSLEMAKMELEEQGFIINATDPAEILFEIDDLYRDAIAQINDKAQHRLSEYTEEEVKAIKDDISGSIYKGKAELGTKTKIAELLDNKDNEIKTIKAGGRLINMAQSLKDYYKKGSFRSVADLGGSDIIDVIAGKNGIGGIVYRGNINKTGTRKIVKNMREWYNKDTNKIFENSAVEFDEQIASYMDDIASGEGDLTIAEIKNLERVVSYFKHFMENYNYILRNGKRLDAKEVAEKNYKAIKDDEKLGLNVKRNENKYFDNFADPMTLARRADNYREDGFFSSTFEELRQGALQTQLNYIELASELNEFYKKHKGFRRGLRSKKKTITFRGKEYLPATLMTLYETAKREQAQLGLAESGISYYIDDKKHTINESEIAGFMPNVTNEEELHKAMKDFADEIYSKFDETQKEYIKLVERAMELAKEKKRVEDMRSKGYSNVIDGFYFPIKRGNIPVSIEEMISDELTSLRNASFNKDTIKGAKNRLFIGFIDDIVDSHLHSVALYNGLNTAISNFEMLYNINLGTNNNNPTTLRGTTANIWKDNYKYIRELIDDIKGVGKKKSGVIGKLRGNFAISVLGFNPKVWFTQLSSLGASLHKLSLGSVMKSSTMTVKDEVLDKYSKAARVRNYDNAAAKSQALVDKASGIGEWLMKPIGFMDRFVVKRLFVACQYEVQKNYGYKVGTEENLVKAGEMLDEVIFETQQNAIATEKSKAMRSDSELAKSVTMFTSDAMKNVSRLIEAVDKHHVLKVRLKKETDLAKRSALEKQVKEANKQIAKSTGAMVSVAVFMTLVTQLFRLALAQDDDKEDDIKLLQKRIANAKTEEEREMYQSQLDKVYSEYGKNITTDVIGNLLGGLPAIKEVYSFMVDGYEIESQSFASVNELLGGTKKLFDTISDATSGKATSQQTLNALREVFYAGGRLVGIPTRNIYKYFYGTAKRFDRSLGYKADATFYKKSYRSDLKKAIEMEDVKMVNTIAELMTNESFGTEMTEGTRNEISRLLTLGYDNIIPRVVGDKVSVNGIEYELDAKARRTIKDVYKTADKSLASLVNTQAYKDAPDEVKARSIKFLYNTFYNLGVEKALGVDIEGKNLLMAQVMPLEKLAIAVNGARVIEGELNRKGVTIQGSRKRNIISWLIKMRLTSAQRNLILGYLGYKVDEYSMGYVRSYVNSQRLSRAEKLELLKMCGYDK